MLTCVNGGITAIKPGHQTAGNMHVIWSYVSSFTLLPASGKVYVWEHPRSLRSGMPGFNNETHGRLCDGLGRNIVVQYSVGLIITLHGQITAREHVEKLGNQVHPMIQT
jgi:hypothetical protein